MGVGRVVACNSEWNYPSIRTFGAVRCGWSRQKMRSRTGVGAADCRLRAGVEGPIFSSSSSSRISTGRPCAPNCSSAAMNDHIWMME